MLQTALIITTYNRPDALKLCLNSVANQVVFPNEIIVADDGSGKETKDVIENFAKSVQVPVKHVWQEDKGFRLAEVRNRAIIKSGSDYLIFIDGDIIIHPYFVYDHLKNKLEKTFISGSRVLLSEKETQKRIAQISLHINLANGSKNKLNAIRSSILSKVFSKIDSGIYNVRGCNMSFWKKDLQAVNGFDSRYVGWGREDSDLVQRLLNRGTRKLKLKFAAVQYHLYHSDIDRNRLTHNETLLSETKDGHRLWAEEGLNDLNNGE